MGELGSGTSIVNYVRLNLDLQKQFSLRQHQLFLLFLGEIFLLSGYDLPEWHRVDSPVRRQGCEIRPRMDVLAHLLPGCACQD